MVSTAFRYCLAGTAVLAALALSLRPSAAYAEQSPQQQEQRVEGTGGANLPEWARSNQRMQQQSAQQQGMSGAQQQQQPPDFPDDPAIAPIGGLEWLALAGGAYAMNGLRRRRSEEENDEEGGEPLA